MKNALFALPLIIVLLGAGGCARPLASGALRAGVEAASGNDWEEAVRYWTKALEQDPGSPAAHNNLAVALERQGAWEEARREYEAALRLDPDNRTIKDNYESFKARQESGRWRAP